MLKCEYYDFIYSFYKIWMYEISSKQIRDITIEAMSARKIVLDNNKSFIDPYVP